jgi:hypothetical protein
MKPEEGIVENQKLHQSGAELEISAIFGYVPWRHHVEIITKSWEKKR